jgi:hypothetical protein
LKLVDVKVTILWEGVVLTYPFHRSAGQTEDYRPDLLKTNRNKSLTLCPIVSSQVPLHLDYSEIMLIFYSFTERGAFWYFSVRTNYL